MIGMKEVRLMRHRLDITQEEAARRARVSLATYRNWETGRNRPSRMGRRYLMPMIAEAERRAETEKG